MMYCCCREGGDGSVSETTLSSAVMTFGDSIFYPHYPSSSQLQQYISSLSNFQGCCLQLRAVSV